MTKITNAFINFICKRRKRLLHLCPLAFKSDQIKFICHKQQQTEKQTERNKRWRELIGSKLRRH